MDRTERLLIVGIGALVFLVILALMGGIAELYFECQCPCICCP